jgi:hypothetical protein
VTSLITSVLWDAAAGSVYMRDLTAQLRDEKERNRLASYFNVERGAVTSNA